MKKYYDYDSLTIGEIKNETVNSVADWFDVAPKHVKMLYFVQGDEYMYRDDIENKFDDDNLYCEVKVYVSVKLKDKELFGIAWCNLDYGTGELSFSTMTDMNGEQPEEYKPVI